MREKQRRKRKGKARAREGGWRGGRQRKGVEEGMELRGRKERRDTELIARVLMRAINRRPIFVIRRAVFISRRPFALLLTKLYPTPYSTPLHPFLCHPPPSYLCQLPFHLPLPLGPATPIPTVIALNKDMQSHTISKWTFLSTVLIIITNTIAILSSLSVTTISDITPDFMALIITHYHHRHHNLIMREVGRLCKVL